jgi:hypothetical protein
MFGIIYWRVIKMDEGSPIVSGNNVLNNFSDRN